MDIHQIYLDNFRGFKDATITLAQVNFFVGENSTGKTSLLKLIDLLSAGDFWFNGHFRTANVDFSYYGDVASDTTSQVKIGLYYNPDKNQPDTPGSAIMLTLAQGRNSKTMLKSMRCSYKDKELQVLFDSAGRVRYKVKIGTGFVSEDFMKWAQGESDSTGYQYLKDTLRGVMNNAPYFIVNTLEEFGDPKKDKAEFTPPPFMNAVQPFTWVAPIRVKPRQTYDGNVYDYSAEGEHVPYILKNIISKKRAKHSLKVMSALEKFGKESGLFDTINVRQFGRDGNSPFSIEVILDGQSRHITNVGYGVAQVLPIVSELLNHTGYRFAIQQPEVHLHPRAQASLGGFFFDLAKNTSAQLIVETHSDFIIDRYRQRMHQDGKKPETQVVFFEHKASKNIAHTIKINADGTYEEKQPDSFRKFFFDEELKNIAI